MLLQDALEKLKKGATTLNLRNNELGEDAGKAIADALSVNTTLTTLYLCENKLGKDAETVICQSWGNKTLKLYM